MQGAPALALIAAVAKNGVIGVANTLPWRLRDDLRHFRALTTGHAVIMGRKTWESLGRALPERQNIVVTRQSGFRAEGAEIARSLPEAITKVARPTPVFCIGGGELYRVALARAATLYLTEIDRNFEGDVTFPSFDRAAWPETRSESRRGEGPDAFTYRFVTRERRVR